MFGDIEVASSMKDIEDRLLPLTDALYQRRVVPLVGAGVSVPRVKGAEELVSELAKLKIDQHWGSRDGVKSLSRACEVALIGGLSHADVCGALGIKGWAGISPTPAHRYMAMLAADGFIDEIVTTNYDCGVEAAWRALGRRGGLFVIASAQDNHHPRPRGSHLCLYKINGCAASFKEAKDADEAAAQRILLTDTQLQGIQNRQERAWVGTFLSHLVRSRSLLLSGFGSDEPQVWRAVRTILDELTVLKDNTSTNSNTSEKPVRLWVALYDNTLPFHLLTVLLEDAKLRGTRPLEDGFDNLFSKADRKLFGMSCSSPGLDAGAFWRRLWLEMLLRSLGDEHRAAAAVFTRVQLGRRARPMRAEDSPAFRLWKEIVEEVFDRVPLDQPGDWTKETKDQPDVPGAPGIAWAESRYVTVDEEPEYWVVALLLVLAGKKDIIEVESHDGEPVVVVHEGALDVGSRPPVGRDGVHVNLDRRDERRQVTLRVRADLLLGSRWVNGPRNLDGVRQQVCQLLMSSLHAARQHEARRRTTRRLP